MLFFRVLPLIIVIGFSGSISTAKADQSYTFKAFGAIWRASDIKQVRIEKQTMASLRVELFKPGEGSATAPQMLSKFCGEFVKRNLKQKIFRVDLTVVATLGPDKKPVWPTPVPIQVRANKCQTNPESGGYFIKYSGRLEGWKFSRGTVQKSGAKYQRLIVFEPAYNADVKLDDFDFDFACMATLKDPTIQESLAGYEKTLTNITIQPNMVTIIAKQNSKQGIFIGEIFKTARGRCVKQ